MKTTKDLYKPAKNAAEAKSRALLCKREGQLHFQLIRAVRHGDALTAKALLEVKADPNYRDKIGTTALRECIHGGRKDLLELLLQYGVDPNLDIGPFPTVLEAVFYRQPEIIKVLAENGANLNAKTKLGNSALLQGVKSGNAEIVRLLIELGADAGIRDIDDRTPLDWANQLRHPQIVKILEKAKAPTSPGWLETKNLIEAAKKGELKTITKLVKQKVDVDGQDTVQECRCTALMAAARAGKPAAVKLLLRHGASVDAVDLKRRTALMYAAEAGSVNAAKALMDAGAKVDAFDADGLGSLSWAVLGQQRETCRLLLKAGAKVNRTDQLGRSALIIACSLGNSEIAELLLSAGSDVNAADNAGSKPLTLAVVTNAALVRLLVSAGANVNATNQAGETVLDIAKRVKNRAAVDIVLQGKAALKATPRSNRTNAQKKRISRPRS